MLRLQVGAAPARHVAFCGAPLPPPGPRAPALRAPLPCQSVPPCPLPRLLQWPMRPRSPCLRWALCAPPWTSARLQRQQQQRRARPHGLWPSARRLSPGCSRPPCQQQRCPLPQRRQQLGSRRRRLQEPIWPALKHKRIFRSAPSCSAPPSRRRSQPSCPLSSRCRPLPAASSGPAAREQLGSKGRAASRRRWTCSGWPPQRSRRHQLPSRPLQRRMASS